MNRIKGIPMILAFLVSLPFGWGLAATNEPAATNVTPLRLAINLADGSRLIGVPDTAVLRVQTSYAKMEVPLDRISRVTIGTNREQIVFQMKNGDQLRGALLSKGLELKVIFGKVTVGADQIAGIDVLEGGAIPGGLVLWNSLGSEADITHSRVGPAGIFRGGRFREGLSGTAFAAGPNHKAAVAFPKEIIPLKAGCIELWVKLEGFPDELPWAANPNIFNLSSPEGGFNLELNGNDGGGRGGVCGTAGKLGVGATCQFGNFPYAQLFEEGTPKDWHHYALVWDQAGIKGVGDGTHTVAVFLDGKLNSTLWGGEPAPGKIELPPLSKGELVLMLRQDRTQGTVIMEELKIWSYAKTDFSDSLEEKTRGTPMKPPSKLPFNTNSLVPL
jgi:hypothetical protein